MTGVLLPPVQVAEAGPTLSGEARTRRLEDTLRVGQVVVLMLLALVIAALGNEARAVPHLALAGAELLIAAHVALRGPRLVQLLAAVALATWTAYLAGKSGYDGAAGVTVACAMLCSIRLFRGRALLIALATPGVLSFAVRMVDHFPEWREVETLLLGAGPVYAAAVLVQHVMRGAHNADLEAAAAEASEQDLARHEAEVRAVDRTRRVLHDDVLTALGAIEDSALRALHTCTALSRRAVFSVAEVSGVSGVGVNGAPLVAAETTALDQMLTQAVAAAPVEVEVHTDLPDGRPHLHRDVLEAGQRALEEALRNVARHTTCRSASLEVRTEGDRLRLAVSDEGGGFPAGYECGYGVADSIRGAVEAVGGSAEVGNHGRGARVEIVLPLLVAPPRPDSLRIAREQTEAAVGPVAGLVRQLTAILVGMQVLVGVHYAVIGEHRVAELALILALTSLAVVHTRLVVRGPLSPALQDLFSVVIIALLLCGVLLVPTGGYGNLHSWAIGFTGAILTVWVLLLPASYALCLLAALTAVVLLAAWLDPTLLGNHLPVAVLQAILVNPLMAWVIGALIRRDGQAVLHDRARGASRLADLELRRQLSRAVSLHLDHTRRVIVPWLSRIAQGQLVPSDPAVRGQARVLEREARDDLHAAGFFDDRLRKEVSRWRADGGTVDIRPGLRPGSHARITGALLRSLVVALPPTHRITVSPAPQDPHRARVAVVPPPALELGGVIPPGARVVSHDGDRMVLTVTEVGV